MLRGVVPLLGAERRRIELAIDHTRIAEQRLLLGRALVEEATLTAVDLLAELRAEAEGAPQLLGAEPQRLGDDTLGLALEACACVGEVRGQPLGEGFGWGNE